MEQDTARFRRIGGPNRDTTAAGVEDDIIGDEWRGDPLEDVRRHSGVGVRVTDRIQWDEPADVFRAEEDRPADRVSDIRALLGYARPSRIRRRR
jgi:hypothetical protein